MQNLNFTKKIRYESRKQLAQARPRVKGQFVRITSEDVNDVVDSLTPAQMVSALLHFICHPLTSYCHVKIWLLSILSLFNLSEKHILSTTLLKPVHIESFFIFAWSSHVSKFVRASQREWLWNYKISVTWISNTPSVMRLKCRTRVMVILNNHPASGSKIKSHATAITTALAWWQIIQEPSFFCQQILWPLESFSHAYCNQENRQFMLMWYLVK